MIAKHLSTYNTRKDCEFMDMDKAGDRLKRLNTQKLVYQYIEDHNESEVFEIREISNALELGYDATKNALNRLADQRKISTVRTPQYAIYGKHRAIKTLKTKVGWKE